MNDVERVKTMRRELAREAAERYRSRTAARDAKLAEVQKHGVMVAAGRAGIIRAGHMTVAEGRTLEAITGQNYIDQVNFLERGMRAAKAVCRILIGGDPIGTGFLVGPGLLITNHHVIPDRAAAQDATA